jgi:hypothetical protein
MSAYTVAYLGSIRRGGCGSYHRAGPESLLGEFHRPRLPQEPPMRKAIPATMFTGKEAARLSVLQQWVLEQGVTEIEMNERQFWNFVSIQPVAEKPWTTYMGRLLHVSDMPLDSQKRLGLFDKRTPGAI